MITGKTVVRLAGTGMLLLLMLVSMSRTAVAQSCPICTIDLTCDSVPAGPKLCPSALPTDTAQQYYEADVTFYMPQQFDITDPISATVDLQQIDVVGLSGLPAGMQWTAYDYTGTSVLTFYPPANPPASERGCAKICGTPLMPGNYMITVSVLAYVNVGSQSVTQAESFDVPLTIVPNPSGNSVFTMSNNQGCDSVHTDFAPILQSGGDPLYVYTWDFGDGNTSNVEFPSNDYTVPGDYVVSCQMDILQYVVSSISVNVTNDDWCGDVEEPYIFVCTGSPDVYFRINDGYSLYDGPTVDNTLSPSWSNVGYVLEGGQFTIQFFDEDNVSQHDDLGLTIVNVTGTGTYNIATISPYSGTQAINGTLTIITQVDTTYIDYDTVHVYAFPSPDPITFSANDSVCAGDSVTLMTGGGTFYQWYNDTNLLIGATDSVYIAYQSGDYWATVTSNKGCESSTGVQPVRVIPYPSIPMFFQNGNILTSFTNEPNLQWYLNSAPIPGATGNTYTISQDGSYFLLATNVLGCISSSDTLTLSYIPPIINPVISPDIITASTPESVPVSICLDVTDADSNALDVTGIASGPSNGTVSGLSDGDTCFLYTPNAGFSGVDVVEVIVCDASGGCDTAEVSITVTLVNTAPVIWPKVVMLNAAGQTPLSICLKATDADYDNLDITVIATGPANGTVTGLSDGDTCFTYTANQGFSGLDTMLVVVCDGFGGCDTALVVANVTEVIGINETSEKTDNLVHVYPNPNAGSFTIETGALVVENLRLTVRDLVGRTLFAKDYGQVTGAFTTVVDLGEIQAGVYTVVVDINSRSFHRKVLVK